MIFRTMALSILCMAASTASLAHVTLETRQAAQGATYKAVLRVTHGCDGSATKALRVRIPEGVVGVKPMPKPGWTIELKQGKYSKTYEGNEGAKLSEGVQEVIWSGGTLPDNFYDEFVFRAFITSDLPAGKPVYLPVVQECEKGVHRWIEIPVAGKKLDDYPEPAAELVITPKK